MLLPPTLKNAIKVKFAPPDIRTQSRKLPHPIHLLIPMRVETVRMPFHRHFFEGGVFVALVGDAQLVVAGDFGVGDFFPFGAADEVLGFEGWVA